MTTTVTAFDSLRFISRQGELGERSLIQNHLSQAHLMIGSESRVRRCSQTYVDMADSPRRPISLESEKQKALLNIMAVDRDLREFKEIKFKDPDETEISAWLQFSEAAHQNNKAKRIVRNLREFQIILDKYVGDKPKEADNPVYQQLREVIDKGQQFENVISRCKRKIKNTMENHVGKYCLSFSAEAENIDLPLVFEYENTTTKWRQRAAEAEKKLESSYQCLMTIFSNVNEYLLNYPHAVHFMTLCIDSLPKMYSSVKSWVTADKVYGRKLKSLISTVEREKEAIDEEIRQCGFQIEDIKRGIQRQNRDVDRHRENLRSTIRRKHACRKQEYAMSDRQIELRKTLAGKKKELESTLFNLHHSKTNCPGLYEQLLLDSNRLEEEISELEYMLSDARDSLVCFKKEKCYIQKDVHKMRGTYERNVKKQKYQIQSADLKNEQILSLLGEQKEVSQKLSALRKIYALKFNRGTVKRIFDEDYIPGVKDTLGSIGLRSKSLDTGFDQLEIADQHKWSRLSRNASVNALSRTLRTIRINDIGNQKNNQGNKAVLIVN